MAWWIGLIITGIIVVGIGVFWAYIAVSSMKGWYF